MILMPNEQIVSKCTLKAFTATLTNFRLCIDSKVSEESYPTDSLTGMAILEDTIGYKAEFKRQRKNIRICGIIIAWACALFVYNVLHEYSFQLFWGLVIIISGLSFLLPPQVNVNSVLRIAQLGGSREFVFSKTDFGATQIRAFVDEINTEFILRKQSVQNNVQTQNAPPQQYSATITPSIATATSNHQERITQLQQLKQLLDSGILTQTEFDQQKAQILTS